MTDPLLDALLRSAPGEEQMIDPALALARAIGRPAWHAKAHCSGIGPDVFHPGRGESTKPAKAICAGCPVVAPCRAYADAHDTPGVWGGSSPQERRRSTAA